MLEILTKIEMNLRYHGRKCNSENNAGIFPDIEQRIVENVRNA
jgi:hypothetical protein